MNIFGNHLKELRRQRHFTQRSFAKELGIDFTYISKIENGRVENLPSEDLIKRMARVLDVDSNDLLDIAGKFDPDELREAVIDQPKVGILLRRLQSKQLSADQIDDIMKIVQNSINE